MTRAGLPPVGGSGEDAPLAAHVRQARRSGAAVPKEWLGEPEKANPPHGFEFVWDCFVDLSAARGSSGFGPSPLAWADVEAYCRLTGTTLDVWEVGLVMRCDRAWMRVVSDHMRAQREAEKAKRSGPKGD